jgi:hypothetical protein
MGLMLRLRIINKKEYGKIGVKNTERLRILKKNEEIIYEKCNNHIFVLLHV